MKPQWEWGVPLAIGLVFGLGLWGLTAGSDGGTGPVDGDTESNGPTSPNEVPQPILLPFASALGVDGTNTTFVVLAPLGRAAAEPLLDGEALAWQGDRLALYTGHHRDLRCRPAADGVGTVCPMGDPPWALGDWHLPRTDGTADPEGPRLMRDGYNATKVTAYIFNETGHLLGSNANDTSRFAKHDDYFRLQSSAWYLGENSTAPNGTAHLPGFAKPLIDRVRPQLDGLPVGGVASVRSNAYVALYGTLFVTIRVDILVYAP